MTARHPMPAVFLGHGSPMNALETNRYTRAWRDVAAALPRPRTILAVSAHWYGPWLRVTAMEQPRTIHDFGGFPPELFAVRYRAPGDPALAERVRALLAPLAVAPDQAWGLDHGTWSVLVHAFPDADVPVVQLSLDASRPAEWHWRIAATLGALRDEGVLILGSGNIVHNLARIDWHAEAAAFPWAVRFDDRVRRLIEAGDGAGLIATLESDDDARLSVPTPDHFLPLLYVLAVQRPGERVRFPVDGIELGSIGMRAVVVGM